MKEVEGKIQEINNVSEGNTPKKPKKERFIKKVVHAIGNVFKGPGVNIDKLEQDILKSAKHAVELEATRAEALFSEKMCPRCETVKLEGGMQSEGYVRCNCPDCKSVFEQYHPYGRVYQILSEPEQ